MAGGLHCCDCVFATLAKNEESGAYQCACGKGYTLANPHVHTDPERFFDEDPRKLVPMVDPFGKEFLRTENVCKSFRPRAAAVQGPKGRRANWNFWGKRTRST